MGFTEQQAKEALSKCGYDEEKAL